MGNDESECGINKSREPRSGSRSDLFVPRSDSFSMNQEKRHSFLILTMFPSKILSNSPRKVIIQISIIYGHAKPYLMLITARVIWPTGELLYDCVHRELDRKF